MTPVERIQELEEVIRLLQLENDRLSEQAEDNLLLGQIGERLATAKDRAEPLAAMLEQISLLKDIPFCACCRATEAGAPAAAGARIEDSREVRQLVCRVLSEKGYRVLEAGTGEEALGLALAETGRIDLLLTDVVIPGMNGRRLSERLATSRPGMKVLFMSGYTANLIVHHGVLDQGLNFLPKPFGPATLARKVREVLDQS